MLFKKYSPSKQYEHFIAYFWTLKSSECDVSSAMYRFVPDGYVDWVFHFGTPWQCDFPDVVSQSKTGKYHVFGQIKKHINLSIPEQDLDVFGVKFHPWVANKIWKIDMHHLTNSCLDLTELELNDMHILQERVCLEMDLHNKMKRIEDYLFSYLNYNEDKSLKKMFVKLNSSTDSLSFFNLGIGLRRLEQRFKNEIGITPKLFLRTQRLNTVIEKMKLKTNQSLTQLALEHNYYDQSHFIKDFKQFTGLNPSQFLKSINPNGDILNLRVS